MFKNYLKTALRNFWRQKTYSSINMVGLSVGLACSFLIFLWVKHELSYDQFHEHGAQIHRVMRNYSSNNKIYTWSATPMPLAKVLEEEYPEVTHAILTTWTQKKLLSKADKVFRENGIYASPAFFEVFTFPIIQGSSQTALSEPNAIAISEGLARKYFGTDWASKSIIGQSLTLNHRKDYTVQAVFKDVPSNSSLGFKFVLPMADYLADKKWLEHWGNNSLRMYVKLQEGVVLADFNAKVEKVILKYHKSARATVFLQPFLDMHLYSEFKNGKLVGGGIEYVRLFTVVALFILLIACINFMNLATARSTQRAREVGVRKAVGASKLRLAGQFMGESMLMTVFAAILALGLVELLLPQFNEMTRKSLVADWLDINTLPVFLGIALLTGLLAGSYPAFYLSGFNPVTILRGAFKAGAGAGFLRQGLVTFQFALTILLIIGTLTVYEQMTYIRGKNLGLDRENLITMTLEGPIKKQYDVFKQELLRLPGIQMVTASNQNPLSVGNSTSDPKWQGKDPEAELLFHIINSNFDFVETMKMNVIQGRSFDKAFASDTSSYVINAEMARVMDMDNPVGTTLKFWGDEGQIIGVVDDFHFSSLYSSFEPLIIRLDPPETWRLYVRTGEGQTDAALASLETVFKKFNANYPFEYRFMDEDFERMYRKEKLMGSLALSFAILAIFISCLGLFGLASFTAEQRTKEIGVRKVLGASVSNLILLLSKEFLRLVAVAFVFAAPMAYYLMSGWLDDFAYRINLGGGVFVFAGLLAFVIAWATVSYQAFKVASANPITSLRYE